MENKEELETYKEIISSSNKKLSTLGVLSHFFSHSDLIAIQIRTKVIHNLFEANRNLDIHKLDLFHLQYTNSLIELFQKLKKSKEQKYLLLNDEMYINEDFIKKLRSELDTVDFASEVKAYNQLVSSKIEQLYKELESGQISRFSWHEVTAFSMKYREEFYRDLTEAQYLKLTGHDDAPKYHNEHVTVEKKLLGKLNIQKFKLKLVCGFAYGDEALEVFEFVNSNDRFVFLPAKKAFYLLDQTQLAGLDLEKNQSNRQEIIEQLMYKNTLLKEKLSSVKTSMPREVEEVLESYLAKISGVDFLDDLQSVDEQTNILKAMLNINIK